jgi:hypothetical protein
MLIWRVHVTIFAVETQQFFSLCIFADLHKAVNSIKLLSLGTERRKIGSVCAVVELQNISHSLQQ